MTPREARLLEIAGAVTNAAAAELKKHNILPEEEAFVKKEATKFWLIGVEKNAREDSSNPVR